MYWLRKRVLISKMENIKWRKQNISERNSRCRSDECSPYEWRLENRISNIPKPFTVPHLTSWLRWIRYGGPVSGNFVTLRCIHQYFIPKYPCAWQARSRDWTNMRLSQAIIATLIVTLTTWSFQREDESGETHPCHLETWLWWTVAAAVTVTSKVEEIPIEKTDAEWVRSIRQGLCFVYTPDSKHVLVSNFLKML